MKVEEFLSSATETLKQAQIESPRLEVEMFMAEVLSCERSSLILRHNDELDLFSEDRLKGLLRRRQKGEPLAYILGYKDFYRDRFLVQPGVLIPRNETEMLVECGESWIRSHGFKSPVIADLGCGSGCLGLSLLKACGGKLLAVDAGEIPIRVSYQNCVNLGLEGETNFLQCRVQDLSSNNLPPNWNMGEVDIVLANPPYIAESDPHVCPQVRRTEPSQALFAGKDGLQEIREWIPTIVTLLRPGGLLCLEHGAKQGEAVCKHLADAGHFEWIQSYRDLAGWDRMVTAKKKK